MLKSKSQLRAKTSLKAKSQLKRTNKPKKQVPLEKRTAQQLIKVADKYFSRYVRLRDSARVGDEWIGTCITCTKTGVVAYLDDKGVLRFIKGWDNGHFVTRGNFIVRYREENCNLQCSFRCNKMKSGEVVKYRSALKDKYGSEIPGELDALADEFPGPTYHLLKPELLEIIHDSKVQIAYMQEQ